MVKISDRVKKFITHLEEHPEDFVFEGYTIKHKENNVSVWVSNGFWFFKFYNTGIDFTFFEKMYAWAPIIKFLGPHKKRNSIIKNMNDEKSGHALDEVKY